ncbi:MAG: LD-carboxypeptidase [Candidatus Cloacimonetes bacterium]|nr:LD-carboxypeptidase [Candidatus Cloacimonadota bacterium]
MPIKSIQFFAPASPVSDDAGQWIRDLFPTLLIRPAPRAELHNGLHGNDETRASELDFLKNPHPDTLYMGGRGGYGSMRCLNQWLKQGRISDSKAFVCGFSDLTVFLNYLPRYGISCWHGPLGMFPKNPPPPDGRLVQSFRSLIENRGFSYPISQGHKFKGRVIGGNLTVFLSLLGTRFEPEWEGKILLLEDVSESTYRLDRMLTQILSHKKFKSLSGVLLGQFTACSPQKGDGFNASLQDVCADFVCKSSVSVVEDVATGHIEDLLVIPMDREVTVMDGSICWDAIPERG